MSDADKGMPSGPPRGNGGKYLGFPMRFTNWYRRKRRKIARRLIIRDLESVANEAELGLWAQALLVYFRRFSSGYRVMPLTGYGQLPGQTIELVKPTSCVVVPPCPLGAEPTETEGRFPGITARVAEAVEGAACSSALVADGRVHLPDYFADHGHATASDRRSLFWHSQDGSALISDSKEGVHDAAIMLFGWGSYNWYHWLLEVLPSAYLARFLPSGFADFPLAIPADIAELPTFRESIEVLRNGREVVVVGSGFQEFNRLVVIDPPVVEPMNLREGKWPETRDYSFSSEVLLGYRDAIRDGLGIAIGRSDDRVFLARGSQRRVYNQDELLEIAERYGFRAIYPERMTFREQVETLSHAAFVVGPSGAAFANSLFCQPGTRLLSWLVPQYREFCCYTNIATTVGADLRYLFAVPDKVIESASDAFSSGYRIDPGEFDSALSMMLESPDF